MAGVSSVAGSICTKTSSARRRARARGSAFEPRRDATYLVTGGLGGLGLTLTANGTTLPGSTLVRVHPTQLYETLIALAPASPCQSWREERDPAPETARWIERVTPSLTFREWVSPQGGWVERNGGHRRHAAREIAKSPRRLRRGDDGVPQPAFVLVRAVIGRSPGKAALVLIAERRHIGGITPFYLGPAADLTRATAPDIAARVSADLAS